MDPKEIKRIDNHKLYKFEPGRGDEYTRMLVVRTGMPKLIGDRDIQPYYLHVYRMFGHEWAASHNRVALQNILNRIIVECTPDYYAERSIFGKPIPEYLKYEIMNFAWVVFKCAWINADEYLPDSKYEIKKNHKRKKK